MATREAEIRRAQLPEQRDLTKRREHCSAAPELLVAIGVAVRQQVRIIRTPDEYALYTVSEVRPEPDDNVVRMGPGGRERLGMEEGFGGEIDSQVPRPDLSPEDAEKQSEFIEQLCDNGRQRGLIAIAPHGGDIEAHTDEQAERVASQLEAMKVSSWRCKGWKRGGGAFARWHITSTDINEASFPGLRSVMARGFTYAVAFHGFDEDEILIGGAAGPELKEEIREAIARATAAANINVRIAGPDEEFGGDDPCNIVNRLTAGGKNGIQIEQSCPAREDHWPAIADAVVEVYGKRLRSQTPPWFAPVQGFLGGLRKKIGRIIKRLTGQQP
jgi:phage replication-related protein YjqB (UPF0714/DUF867 family)